MTEAYRPLAVDVQEAQADSHLHFYRALLAWRKAHPVLIQGEQTLWPLHPQVLAFEREHEGQTVLCAFNFSAQPASIELPAEWRAAMPLPLKVPGLSGARLAPNTLEFEPYAGLLLAR